MALIKCPECGKEVSTAAEACPHCGYPLKSRKPTEYETKTIKIRCWGRSQDSINKKLEPYTSEGWQVVSMVEDHWQGGLLSPVYKVVIKRPIKYKCPKCREFFEGKQDNCPHCGAKLAWGSQSDK